VCQLIVVDSKELTSSSYSDENFACAFLAMLNITMIFFSSHLSILCFLSALAVHFNVYVCYENKKAVLVNIRRTYVPLALALNHGDRCSE